MLKRCNVTSTCTCGRSTYHDSFADHHFVAALLTTHSSNTSSVTFQTQKFPGLRTFSWASFSSRAYTAGLQLRRFAQYVMLQAMNLWIETCSLSRPLHLRYSFKLNETKHVSAKDKLDPCRPYEIHAPLDVTMAFLSGIMQYLSPNIQT